MVDPAVRGKGLATEITRCFLERAKSLSLSLVMRTQSSSPMARIADKFKMPQVIGPEEDGENQGRVLYVIKI